MLQFFRDVSIRLKISGFVIPSTIAFGIVMTVLSLYFLNDFKTSALKDFGSALDQLQQVNENLTDINTEPILRKISEKAEEEIQHIGFLLISIVVAVIILATAGAMLISAIISKPVRNAARGLENISSGDADLAQRLPLAGNDETGQVCRFFNAFLEKLQKIIRNLQNDAEQLNEAIRLIHSRIEVIQQKSTSAKDISQTVFRSATYMNKDMQEISSILEQSNESIQLIATAVGELSQTVEEIAATSAKAHTNTEITKNKMEDVGNDVKELGQAAEDISKVTETIAEISEQVNLLALNATIEAARAGEAGKGFAVVANEIKELARQTATAATEIKQRIEQVQTVTQNTINGIIEATETVSQNTDVVSTIATAVEEQTTTVNDIASSISNAADKLGYANEKVFKASEYANNMAGMANDVTEAVLEVDEAVVAILQTSTDIKEMADESARTTRQFRT